MSSRYSVRSNQNTRPALAALPTGRMRVVRVGDSPSPSIPGEFVTPTTGRADDGFGLSPLTPLSKMPSRRTGPNDRSQPTLGQTASEAEDRPKLLYSQAASRTPSPVSREEETRVDEQAVQRTLLRAEAFPTRKDARLPSVPAAQGGFKRSDFGTAAEHALPSVLIYPEEPMMLRPDDKG
ncbi:hypothetical protein OBBRIDRAFT_839325 [Obba rivulosa]|uniref:Uncharacterized protein n=1 Tax=Obba rivulosa TaxID=1052685 RepID=A0A8E2DEK7_9APHY|nr:hypothetical protein OBBRIDRAFT_839325 [Obba rivulosa]